MPRVKASEMNNPNVFLSDLVKDNSGKRVPIFNPNNVLWCWDRYFSDKPNYKKTRDEIIRHIEEKKYYETNKYLPEVGQLMFESDKIIARVQNIIDQYGDKVKLSVMSYQAIRIRDDKLLKFLLDNGLDPNHVDEVGRTLMQVSIMRGVPSTFNLLWEHEKIDRTAKDIDGGNVAHWAVSYSMYSLFPTIVEKAPLLFVQKNDREKTPLDILDAFNWGTGLFHNHNNMNYFKKVPLKSSQQIEILAKELFKNNLLTVGQYKNPDLKQIMSKVYMDILETNDAISSSGEKSEQVKKMKI